MISAKKEVDERWHPRAVLATWQNAAFNRPSYASALVYLCEDVLFSITLILGMTNNYHEILEYLLLNIQMAAISWHERFYHVL